MSEEKIEEQVSSPKRKVIPYLRELSIVIVGVLLTLMLTTLISNRSKRGEADRMLSLIKQELQDNITAVRLTRDRWEEEQRVFDLLKANIDNVEAIPHDTLERYKYVIGRVHWLGYADDTYEVFKSSMLMQYVKNKVLLRELGRVYRDFGNQAQPIITYSEMKKQATYSMLHEVGALDRETMEAVMSGKVPEFYIYPLLNMDYRTFLYAGSTIVSPGSFEECIESAQQMVDKLTGLGY